MDWRFRPVADAGTVVSPPGESDLMSYLMQLADRFPDLPPTVLLKADALRHGVRPVAEIEIEIGPLREMRLSGRPRAAGPPVEADR